MTMNMGNGGTIRRDGTITKVSAAWKTREIDFSAKQSKKVSRFRGAMSPPHFIFDRHSEHRGLYRSARSKSANAPNVALYRLADVNRFYQKHRAQNIPAGGSSDEERKKGKTLLWGEASDKQGNKAEARMQAMEAYTLTALTALNIAEKILGGNFCAGFSNSGKMLRRGFVFWRSKAITREDVR